MTSRADPELYALLAFAVGMGAMVALALRPEVLARLIPLRPLPLHRRALITLRHYL